MLKRLPADESLLFFYGQGCNFTNRVLPEIRCARPAPPARTLLCRLCSHAIALSHARVASGLEAKLGRRVTPLETWNNTANAARLFSSLA